MGSKRLQTVILLLLLAVAFASYVQWSSRPDAGPSSAARQSADSAMR
jgi:hypothetical protein